MQYNIDHCDVPQAPLFSSPAWGRKKYTENPVQFLCWKAGQCEKYEERNGAGRRKRVSLFAGVLHRVAVDMAEKQFFVTEEGLAALEKELEYLKTVRRREVAEKIKVALSFGDLSENSEYDEAKNDQAIMEARIADVEVMLKNAVVIDESELSNETVHIGSKI